MVKIQESSGQFRITISKELMEIMGWKKGEEVIISKYPEKHVLFIEKVNKHAKK